MRIEGYGVVLERLTEDKIEKLRNWRNSPKIAQYMDYKNHITNEMQQKWFMSINNVNNYYFIVNYKNEDIGLVNIKDIDNTKKTGELGIFIYSDEYQNGDVGFRCALCNMDFAFEQLNLDYVYGHVMRDNKRAKRFNSAFGYQIAPNQENLHKQLYILTKERYLLYREKINKLFK